MSKTPIIPKEFRAGAEQMKLSPGLVSGDHVFLTGVTGSDAQGQMPDTLDIQFRTAFDKIGQVLGEAGLDAMGARLQQNIYLTQLLSLQSRLSVCTQMFFEPT